MLTPKHTNARMALHAKDTKNTKINPTEAGFIVLKFKQQLLLWNFNRFILYFRKF